MTICKERFKQLLEEKNLTATRFAAMIKVNASAMSHILNGRSKPGFDVLDKIAQAFPDVNLNWLISGKGALYNNSSVRPAEIKSSSQKTFTVEDKESESSSSRPANTTPAIETTNEIPGPMVSRENAKKIKRIILFFEDGSFEDYRKMIRKIYSGPIKSFRIK